MNQPICTKCSEPWFDNAHVCNATRVASLAAQLAERNAEIASLSDLFKELHEEQVDWARRFKLNDVTPWRWMTRAEAAEAARAACERDAARYRWLRVSESFNWTRPPMRAITIAWMNHATLDEVDAAIDAALAAGKDKP